MKPYVLKGGYFEDERGQLKFNNDFDSSEIKRIYIIQNKNQEIRRGWQGHQIEKRWFVSINGSFVVSVVKIHNFNNPNKEEEIINFHLFAKSMDVLFVPAGHARMIRSIENDSTLLAMSNYKLQEVDDEYKFDPDYFVK